MDHTPDSWDHTPSDGVAGLSISAKPFVPNVNAMTFVPKFGGSTVNAPPPPIPSVDTPVDTPVVTPVVADECVKQTDELDSAAGETNDNWDDNAEEEEPQETPQENGEAEVNGVEEETTDSGDEEKEAPEEEPEEIPEETVTVIKKPSKTPTPEPDDDGRENINIIFIGHVDAGKSTIGGQLLFLTGQVDKRTLEKYEREAKEKNRETWYLSWALDTNLEERDKGKTVECGRASFDTESKHFVLLDAPGHKSFVPNMIGGAAQADVAVLVISARKGEFETGFERGGQTREHAMLAKTAGVKFLIVLVNKMDDSTVEWDEERYKEIISKLSPYLKKTGFKSTEITYLPCSGFTGANLKDRVDQKDCTWYSGPSFLEFLDNLPDFKWCFDGPVKILISDRFRDMGTVVMAKVESGTCKKGDTYTLMPNKQSCRVIGITGADELEKNSCRAGENVKLKLSGAEEDEVVPGFILCEPSTLCSRGRLFDAQVVIMEHKSIICAGYKAILHIHNAVEEVSLVGLIATIDRKTGEKSKQRPRFIKQDSVAVARFRTENVICLETFANFAAMGRFTLRDEGRTIAIGKVLTIIKKQKQVAEVEN